MPCLDWTDQPLKTLSSNKGPCMRKVSLKLCPLFTQTVRRFKNTRHPLTLYHFVVIFVLKDRCKC